MSLFQKGTTERILFTSIEIFIILIFFSFQPVEAQFENSATPCLVDFEDFIHFAEHFVCNDADCSFYPLLDLNCDGAISFPDFILFVGNFKTNSCVSLDSLVIKGQIKIAQIKIANLPQNETQIVISLAKPLKTAGVTAGSSPTFKSRFLDIGSGTEASYPLKILALSNGSFYETGNKEVSLTVNGLVSEGSVFSAEPWALGTIGEYKTPAGEVILSSPYSPADVTLSLRPFAPTDVNQFTPGVYTEASEMIPASGDTLTHKTARTALEVFLSKRIADADSLQQKVSIFDDLILIDKIPNPTLRAGLVSLNGTVAESAIDAIQRGPFGPIAFGIITSGDYAEVKSDNSVIVDERYRSEAFALFGPVFTRIALQTDTQTGRAEEITGSAILALAAMQQALIDSTIAQSGTELSRRLNTQIFARLNSGKAAFPNIGIYQTPEGEAFPNGHTFASYAAVFEPLGDITTPATSLLNTYLKRLAPPETELSNTQTFNTDVLNFLDQHQNVISANELIRVARILKLKLRE